MRGLGPFGQFLVYPFLKEKSTPSRKKFSSRPWVAPETPHQPRGPQASLSLAPRLP